MNSSGPLLIPTVATFALGLPNTKTGTLPGMIASMAAWGGTPLFMMKSTALHPMASCRLDSALRDGLPRAIGPAAEAEAFCIRRA